MDSQSPLGEIGRPSMDCSIRNGKSRSSWRCTLVIFIGQGVWSQLELLKILLTTISLELELNGFFLWQKSKKTVWISFKEPPAVKQKLLIMEL
jgi:hypothetical protein